MICPKCTKIYKASYPENIDYACIIVLGKCQCCLAREEYEKKIDEDNMD